MIFGGLGFSWIDYAEDCLLDLTGLIIGDCDYLDASLINVKTMKHSLTLFTRKNK